VNEMINALDRGGQIDVDLLVLSASPQIRRIPERSKVDVMMPASASNEPG